MSGNRRSERRKKQQRQMRLLLSFFFIIVIMISIVVIQKVLDSDMKKDLQTVENAELEESVTEVLKDTETEEIIEEDTQVSEAFLIQSEVTRISVLQAGEMASVGCLDAAMTEQLFYAVEIDDSLLARMMGCSYQENPNISVTDLSYLRMLYYGLDGNTYVGEMIVNQKIKEDVLSIFRKLYEAKYPIERMVLVDDYDGEDEKSMEANNTSAFNYRTISGSNKLSNHSYGMAIDLNPKYNPYVKERNGKLICQPESGREYADRTKDFAMKIDEEDLAYQLFTEYGFTWGGAWNSSKDYQHFEKE